MLPWYGVRVGRERHQVGDLRLVRVADHPLHARHRRQFFRRALRIAAGHQDARRRILAMHAADGLPHVVIRRRGDGAGVQNDEIGRGAVFGRVEPLGREERLERGAIGLRRAASEILNEVLLHLSIIPGGGLPCHCAT